MVSTQIQAKIYKAQLKECEYHKIQQYFDQDKWKLFLYCNFPCTFSMQSYLTVRLPLYIFELVDLRLCKKKIRIFRDLLLINSTSGICCCMLCLNTITPLSVSQVLNSQVMWCIPWVFYWLNIQQWKSRWSHARQWLIRNLRRPRSGD